MVYPALLPLMRTPRLPVVDWSDAHRRVKWTRTFRRKTKSVFCACAVTFQLACTRIFHALRSETFLHSANRVWRSVKCETQISLWGKMQMDMFAENQKTGLYFSPHASTAPSRPGPAHYRSFTITLRHTTHGMTPLDEWSARRRDVYLTTHDIG
jgi:hypothetical protein